MEEQSSPIDIRDLIWRVRRDFWLLLLPVVAVLCGALLYLRFTPRQYESYMVVSAEDRVSLSGAMDPLIHSDQNRDQPGDRAAVLDSRIHSRPFLLEIGQQMKLGEDPALLAQARGASAGVRGITPEEYASRLLILQLSAMIHVTPLQGSLIRISATGADQAFAMRLATTVGQVLLVEGRRSTVGDAQARSEFSSDQVAVYEGRLHKSEAALRDFQESIIGKRLPSTLIRDQNVDQARLLVQEADDEIAQVRGRIQSELGDWQTRNGPGAVIPSLQSPTARGLEARLSELEVGFGMSSLQNDRTPTDLASQKSKIVEARQALFNEYQSLASSSQGSLSDDAAGAAAAVALDRSILRSVRDKRDHVSKLISDYSRGLVESPRTQMELERLQSDVATNRELLLSLRKEATSSHISEALGVTQLGVPLEIVEPATFPLLPSSPDELKILGAALILGPLLALGLMVGMERLAGVVNTTEQAESEIGASVIGTIPLVLGWRRPGTFLRNNWAMMIVTLIVLATGAIYVAPRPAGSSGKKPASTSGRQP